MEQQRVGWALLVMHVHSIVFDNHPLLATVLSIIDNGSLFHVVSLLIIATVVDTIISTIFITLSILRSGVGIITHI